ncbi:bifunctional phosphoribosylaminoimidazolecarboxamide formyltransferase/IMP cyclohydrolase [bacterium]|nr:bifunctional phosphoribosylaminoimidazolecarboxamide formyltransferase/IMP cyclohydrolase [candidate division CSSED10-310 bacterium]
MKIQRALVSVYDKTGLEFLCKKLAALGIEIVSSGGTAAHLLDLGIPVTRISDITQSPEILNGRVKTLHPAIHAGILADLDNPDHARQLDKMNIKPIGLVVVNLYPFEDAVRSDPEDRKKAVEFIDIGGPAMVRAAAKNFQHVGVVTDPADYSAIVDLLESGNGYLRLQDRVAMAAKAFRKTAGYDLCIADYFDSQTSKKSRNEPENLPDHLELTFRRIRSLRYGENPHQPAALYKAVPTPPDSLSDVRILGGKEISYNNYMDLIAAWQIIRDFDQPAAVVVKHQNPCGAAVSDRLIQAYNKALECDSLSAYGGIVALNRTVDLQTAAMLHKTQFLEVIAAPGFTEKALELLKRKSSRRIVQMPAELFRENIEVKLIAGSALIQMGDRFIETESDYRVVTERHPDSREQRDLMFAWRICRFVKSNAIVFAKDGATVGIGAGQVSRVEAAIIAARKAGERSRDAVMASDAFFPFRDGIDSACVAGITAVIQPGGSKRDIEVIEACNQNGMAMIFTGIRHFRH